MLQNTRTSGNAVHGRIQDEVDRPAAGDGAAPASSSEASQEGNMNVARLTGSVEYGRPLAQGAILRIIMRCFFLSKAHVHIRFSHDVAKCRADLTTNKPSWRCC